jgi:hypothetical protein
MVAALPTDEQHSNHQQPHPVFHVRCEESHRLLSPKAAGTAVPAVGHAGRSMSPTLSRVTSDGGTAFLLGVVEPVACKDTCLLEAFSYPCSALSTFYQCETWSDARSQCPAATTRRRGVLFPCKGPECIKSASRCLKVLLISDQEVKRSLAGQEVNQTDHGADEWPAIYCAHSRSRGHLGVGQHGEYPPVPNHHRL